MILKFAAHAKGIVVLIFRILVGLCLSGNRCCVSDGCPAQVEDVDPYWPSFIIPEVSIVFKRFFNDTCEMQVLAQASSSHTSVVVAHTSPLQILLHHSSGLDVLARNGMDTSVPHAAIHINNTLAWNLILHVCKLVLRVTMAVCVSPRL